MSLSRFKVRGAQSPPETHEQEGSAKPSSNISLPLKLPGRNKSPPMATPPRLEEDVASDLDRSVLRENEENREAEPKTKHGDLLEDLIQEVKGSEVIVRMIVLICGYTSQRV